MSETDRQNYMLGLLALAVATALEAMGKLTPTWVSAMTAVLSIVILGKPMALVAAGWTVAATEKLAALRKGGL
mgnify:CR=1